jgi:hypothetical protein
MSLKGFHIVFVTISTLLCVFMALWAFLISTETAMGIGVTGILGAVIMPVYGVCFYRKAASITL